MRVTVAWSWHESLTCRFQILSSYSLFFYRRKSDSISNQLGNVFFTIIHEVLHPKTQDPTECHMTEVGILTFMCLIKVIKLNNYVRDNGKAIDSLLHHKVLFIIIILHNSRKNITWKFIHIWHQRLMPIFRPEIINWVSANTANYLTWQSIPFVWSKIQSCPNDETKKTTDSEKDKVSLSR